LRALDWRTPTLKRWAIIEHPFGTTVKFLALASLPAATSEMINAIGTSQGITRIRGCCGQECPRSGQMRLAVFRKFSGAVGLAVLGVFCVLLTTASSASQPWHQENGFRWAELKVPAGGKTGFKLLTAQETGINFTNTLDL